MHPCALHPSRLVPLLLVASGSLLLATTYEKRPYLLPSGQVDKMSLVFQTKGAPGSVTVGYGLTPAATDATAPAPTQTNSAFVYRVDMGGLQAGKRYYYKITMDGATDTGSFVAPRPSDRGDFTFYAYGDTRTSLSAHNGVAGSLLSDLNQNPEARGTFLLHVGDYVASGSSESDWTNTFFNASSGANVQKMLANIPLYGVIGNHEGSSGLPLLKKYFPYPFLSASGFYYSFDHGPVHVAVVDSETIGYSSGSAQYTWLKNDLSTSKAPLKVVLYHSPAYSAGGGHSDNSTAKSSIIPLCEQYGVKLVICGDNHYYARIKVKDVHHITSGGGGAPLYTPVSGTSNLVKSASAYHFIRFQVLNNATLLRGTVIKSGGSVIETFDVDLGGAVEEAPAITQQPADQSAKPGEQATFSVQATGNPSPTYQWSRNGQAVQGAVSATYTTPILTTADHGATFSVKVTNRLGSVTSRTATLAVAEGQDQAPAITTQPADAQGQVGGTATFRVTATGSPAPTYQWKRNGANLSGATSATYTTPILAATDQGAKYSVTVTNKVGSVTSREALLTVSSGPSDGNLALNKSASASGQHETFVPANAFDGNTSQPSYWAVSTDSTESHWLKVDLGTSASVGRAKIYWSTSNYAKSYAIQYLDGSTWKTVWSTTSGGSGQKEVTFTPVSAREWRVQMTRKNKSYYTIYEFQLFSK